MATFTVRGENFRFCWWLRQARSMQLAEGELDQRAMEQEKESDGMRKQRPIPNGEHLGSQ